MRLKEVTLNSQKVEQLTEIELFFPKYYSGMKNISAGWKRGHYESESPFSRPSASVIR